MDELVCGIDHQIPNFWEISNISRHFKLEIATRVKGTGPG